MRVCFVFVAFMCTFSLHDFLFEIRETLQEIFVIFSWFRIFRCCKHWLAVCFMFFFCTVAFQLLLMFNMQSKVYFVFFVFVGVCVLLLCVLVAINTSISM